jgi:single-strand DNA-binding protein
MNQVVLVGYVGQDAEVKHVSADFSVTKVRLAVSDGKDKNGERRTVWVDVDCMGFAARSYAKGDRLSVFGKLRLDQWQDRETGANRSKLKVVSNYVVKADLNQSSATTSASQAYDEPAGSYNAQATFTEDDIPF